MQNPPIVGASLGPVYHVSDLQPVLPLFVSPSKHAAGKSQIQQEAWTKGVWRRL